MKNPSVGTIGAIVAAICLVIAAAGCGDTSRAPASPSPFSLASGPAGGGSRIHPLVDYDDGPAPSPAPAPAPTPQTPIRIMITSRYGAQSFSPNPADAGGQVVVFLNADTIVHRVVLNDGTIDTGDIAPGASSQAVQMPLMGANFHCLLHPDMVGAVMATAGGPPPVCTGPYCENPAPDDPLPPPYYGDYGHKSGR